jgi:hypothetical protein
LNVYVVFPELKGKKKKERKSKEVKTPTVTVAFVNTGNTDSIKTPKTFPKSNLIQHLPHGSLAPIL